MQNKSLTAWVAAYRELWLLVTRKPVESPAARGFWKVWIPMYVVGMVAFAVTGADPWSREGLQILVPLTIVTLIVARVMLGPRRKRTSSR